MNVKVFPLAVGEIIIFLLICYLLIILGNESF